MRPQLVLLAGAREPVGVLRLPGDASRLMPESAQSQVLAAPGDDVVAALEALAERLGAARSGASPAARVVIFGPGSTTFAVALVVRALVPDMTWAPAIALGAVVAPPDAVAATAVFRQLRPPHRILTILEGESLLNDASALLIYRLAVGAVAANGSTSATWRRPFSSPLPAA